MMKAEPPTSSTFTFFLFTFALARGEARIDFSEQPERRARLLLEAALGESRL
jgi:hypothetical protein